MSDPEGAPAAKRLRHDSGDANLGGSASALGALAARFAYVPAGAAARSGAVLAAGRIGVGNAARGGSARSGNPAATAPPPTSAPPTAAHTGQAASATALSSAAATRGGSAGVAPASEATVRKWTAFCNPGSSKEVQRYQLLVAVQLSTQANPTVVKQALDRVEREVGGEITPAAIRSLGFERLKSLCERVHRNKQKAGRIVEAAETLRRKHGDVVPRRSRQLQRDFLGVGEQLGDLLESLYAAEWSVGPASAAADGANPAAAGSAVSACVSGAASASVGEAAGAGAGAGASSTAHTRKSELDSSHGSPTASDPCEGASSKSPMAEAKVDKSAAVDINSRVCGAASDAMPTARPQEGAAAPLARAPAVPGPSWVQCPVCSRTVAQGFINEHLDTHL